MDNGQEELLIYIKDHGAPCAKCAYELRGLESVQCPECGYENDMQGVENMIVVQETKEYYWYQSINSFRASQIALTVVLVLDAFILFLTPNRISFNDRGKALAVIVLLVIVNEWFRHWVKQGLLDGDTRVRQVVQKIEMYYYLLAVGALIPLGIFAIWVMLLLTRPY